MRILIFHGYLLHGTGSNIFTANVARALALGGHDVELFCQDRAAEKLGFVNAVVDWRGGKAVTRAVRDEAAGAGRVTVHRPDIAGLLPVYVADPYEGFESRTFPELTQRELDRYVARNVEAVRGARATRPLDCALANHLVMGPSIVSRALSPDVPYAVQIHGSALEYVVSRHDRFLPYAREGLAGARCVIVGSRHVEGRLRQVVGAQAMPARVRIIPPGVDAQQFAPRSLEARREGLRALAESMGERPRSGFGRMQRRALAKLARSGAVDPAAIEAVRTTYDEGGIEPEAPARLAAIAASPGEAPIVAYVGKLIVSKGVDLLMAAWPIVTSKFPEARLVIVGFGAYRPGLELLRVALASANGPLARRIATAGRELEGGAPGPLTVLRNFIDSGSMDDPRYRAAAEHLDETVAFTGRFGHAELRDLLPAVATLVVPSTFPEAFGMVAIEGAAAGAFPIVADHSGLAEASSHLSSELDSATREAMTFRVEPGAPQELARRIVSYVDRRRGERDEARAALRRAVERSFTWERAADRLLDACSGESAG